MAICDFIVSYGIPEISLSFGKDKTPPDFPLFNCDLSLVTSYLKIWPFCNELCSQQETQFLKTIADFPELA